MSDAAVLREDLGDVVRLVVNRPGALNALNRDVLVALDRELDALRDHPTARAIVLAGAGEKAFVAGADIAEMAGMTALEAEAFSALGQAVLEKLSTFRLPVVCAVQGFALGGGCELAMACDIVVAGPKAKFGQPEVKLGVIPGFGGTQRLVRRVGLTVAMDLCLTGRMVDADEAVRTGLAARKVDGDAGEAALAVAREIAKMGPVAVRLCKRALLENADADLRGATAAERTLFALCFATADQKEGMRAFVDRRAAKFVGQ